MFITRTGVVEHTVIVRGNPQKLRKRVTMQRTPVSSVSAFCLLRMTGIFAPIESHFTDCERTVHTISLLPPSSVHHTRQPTRCAIRSLIRSSLQVTPTLITLLASSYTPYAHWATNFPHRISDSHHSCLYLIETISSGRSNRYISLFSAQLHRIGPPVASASFGESPSATSHIFTPRVIQPHPFLLPPSRPL